jgi:hypothetical protein
MLFAPNSDCSRVATVEPLAVLRARNHGLSDTIVALADTVADDERAFLVERRARSTSPVTGSVSWSRYRDN